MQASLLEWALLSDPNINAYSLGMRDVAQRLRKSVLDSTLKESIQYDKYQVPRSVLFVGESGSGKNYLARYLHTISSRRDQMPQYLNFTDMGSSSIEPALFGAGPSSNSQAKHYLNPKNGRIEPGVRNLAVIGAVTNAHNSTLILHELGNSPFEFQVKLIRLLDDRQILPVFWGEYVPSETYYDCWILATMQPQHRGKLKDLERRLSRMTQMEIPNLSHRQEDIIPLAVFALDSSLTTRPGAIIFPRGGKVADR